MTDPRAAAVEAAYLALMKCDLQGGYGSLPTQEDAADFLARMAEAGWVMVLDCGEAHPPMGCAGSQNWQRYVQGWNAYRAAMLGSKDDA